MFASSDSRRTTRRRMVLIAFTVCVVLPAVLFAVGGFYDGVARRLVQMWPVMTTLVPPCFVLIGWYFHIGSQETKAKV